MSWSFGFRARKVNPVQVHEKRSDSISTGHDLEPPNIYNMQFGSTLSISPSQLHGDVMRMLNIRQDATGWRKVCQGNPITKAGQRLQLVRLVGTAIFPIVTLLMLVGYIAGGRITQHYQDFEVRDKVRYSLELSQMLHSLQRERDGSALYVSAIAPETKEFLVNSYPKTNQALMELSRWPHVRLQTNEFSSKELFLSYLNRHRYTIDTEIPDVTKELTFYSKLMSQFLLWFYDAIKEARSGTFWKDLVSLQEIVEAREAFGTERALGIIFFYTGAFDSMDNYLTFVQAQDVGDVTLMSAREYSPVVEALYNQIILKIEEHVGGIVHMRRMVRETVLEHIEPSLTNATLWNNNMTLYLDAMLAMQDKLSIVILEALTMVEHSSQQTIMIVAILFSIVLLMCPLILNAVYSLTVDIQGYAATIALRIKDLDKEHRKVQTLQFHMLPKVIAEHFKNKVEVGAEHFAEVTVFFSGIHGFLEISSRSSPMQVITMLNAFYQCFDEEIKQHDINRVEAIGDLFMLASGIPVRNGDKHAGILADLAFHLHYQVSQLEIPHMPGTSYRLRIGLHTGSVVAGVVGGALPKFCLFGDTVGIASRMQSTGLPGRIQVSKPTHDLLMKLEDKYVLEQRADQLNKLYPETTYWLVQHDGITLPRDAEDVNSFGPLGTPSAGNTGIYYNTASSPHGYDFDDEVYNDIADCNSYIEWRAGN